MAVWQCLSPGGRFWSGGYFHANVTRTRITGAALVLASLIYLWSAMP